MIDRGAHTSETDHSPTERWSSREPLTTREREVLHYVAGGWSNREIAQALALTDHTIKWHLKNVYAKLGVNGRVCAVLAVRGQTQPVSPTASSDTR